MNVFNYFFSHHHPANYLLIRISFCGFCNKISSKSYHYRQWKDGVEEGHSLCILCVNTYI